MPSISDAGPRERPSLPLTVPLILAMAVWILPLLGRTSGYQRDIKDPVADQLKLFREMTDFDERVRAVKRFGSIRDPRVTVALVEVVETELSKVWTESTGMPSLLLAASFALCEHHIPPHDRTSGVKYWTAALIWWEDHEATVRRQASASLRTR